MNNTKVVILAGGRGTRISEESTLRPKPMVEIGGKPILWHIMKIYSHYGLRDFVICLGYKGYVIKEYFANYFLHTTDVTIDLERNRTDFHASTTEPWRISLIDTGEDTMTGGRLKRIRHCLDGCDQVCVTYGDGLADIDIAETIAFHRAHGRKATITVVHQPARFGATVLDGDRVSHFAEKPVDKESFINGGFFVLNPSVLDLIEGDHTVWENEPLSTLAAEGQLAAWRHDGFWQPMDTLREKNQLEDQWLSGKAPWKKW
jgi:glucose-1-phosphate cytidylyltransferase